jgi:hypothetical protein
MDRRKQEAGRLGDPGDIEQQAQLLREKMRSGELEEKKVAFMAFLGYEPARHAIPEEEYKAPEFSSAMAREERGVFFEFIADNFGDLSLLSLFVDVITEFKEFDVSYMAMLEESPSSHIDEAITIFNKMLESEKISEDELPNVRGHLGEDLQRYINFVDTGPGNDDMYAASALDSAFNLVCFFDQRSRPPANAYEALVYPFSEASALPSNTLLSGVSKELRESIEATQTEELVNSFEYYNEIDKMFFSRMKQAGLRWALKDVK